VGRGSTCRLQVGGNDCLKFITIDYDRCLVDCRLVIYSAETASLV